MPNTNIPFEIHLTSSAVNEANLAKFVTICNDFGGKALLIELSRGVHFSQPMSSIVIFEKEIKTVFERCRAFRQTFEKEGFGINRIKIEIPPKYKNHVPIETQTCVYYEWHGKIFYENMELLLAICFKNKVHLSKNALKDSTNMRFITLREYGAEDTFEKRVANLLGDLTAENYIVEKQQFEFCIFDNQVQLDEGWL